MAGGHDAGAGRAGGADLRTGKTQDEIRLADGKRSEEHGIDQAEDGGVASDAESEREDNDGCESGRAGEKAGSVAQVLPEASHWSLQSF